MCDTSPLEGGGAGRACAGMLSQPGRPGKQDRGASGVRNAPQSQPSSKVSRGPETCHSFIAVATRAEAAEKGTFLAGVSAVQVQGSRHRVTATEWAIWLQV